MNDNNNQQGQKPAGKSKKKLLLWGLGALATGLISYFGYQYFSKNKKQKKATPPPAEDLPDTSSYQEPATTTSTAPVKNPIRNAPKTAVNRASIKQPYSTDNSGTYTSDFPLKKGSKNDTVKSLQQFLITKYGASLLPKYGADGSFGTELINALKKLKQPQVIDETTYNIMIQAKKVDAVPVAMGIYKATLKKQFSTVMDLLKQLKSPADYTAVNKIFSQYFLGPVRQTLVNGMLNTFKEESQAQALRFAFAGMGLKYDGSKWSLSGIPDKPLLITNAPTTVWKNRQNSVKVPLNMVLGRQVDTRGDYTLFENESRFFLVKSAHVKPYEN